MTQGNWRDLTRLKDQFLQVDLVFQNPYYSFFAHDSVMDMTIIGAYVTLTLIPPVNLTLVEQHSGMSLSGKTLLACARTSNVSAPLLRHSSGH